MSGGVDILVGDVFAELAKMANDSVDCIITSPPYWGLRDYGVAGQLGLEPTLGEHLDVMVRVCRELRRVLKPGGTFWLNYGDCYVHAPNGRSAADVKALAGDDRTFRDKPFSTVGAIYDPRPGAADRRGKSNNKGNQDQKYHSGRILSGGYLKPKDLCMMPNRLAIALQDDGWWVRSEIIWAKPNPMPESVRDRPATAHEKIFLLTKSGRYDYDAAGVRSKPVRERDYSVPSGWDTAPGPHGTVHRQGRTAIKKDKPRGHARRHAGFDARWDAMSKAEQQALGRHLRNWEPAPELDPALESVARRAELRAWWIATHPFSDAHFATFPPELARRCIVAGCPPGGLVLDPFGGAGTTGLVAQRTRRRAVLIELNPDYAALARRRIDGDMPLFAGSAA